MSEPKQNGSQSKKQKPEMIRIVIYGTHDGTEQIIREFYLCRFSSPTEWSPPASVAGSPGEVMRTYTRRLR